MNTTETKAKLKALEARVKGFQTSEEYLSFLKVSARFHSYSWHNQCLIFSQMPDATRCAGFKTWKKLGRYVKRGEKSIKILAPMTGKKSTTDSEGKEINESFVFFRVVSVFDVSQTDGEALPEIETEISASQDDLYAHVESFTRSEGITLEIDDTLVADGVSSGGKIALRPHKNLTSQAQTLIHELAHEFLHKKSDRNGMDSEGKEIEAETVSHLVLDHFGIESSAHVYLASWLKSGDIMKSLERIAACANKIINGIEREVKKK